MIYSPVYVAFARSNNRTPEQQLAIDRARRTGRMTEFFVFVGEKRQQFIKDGGDMRDKKSWLDFVTAN